MMAAGEKIYKKKQKHPMQKLWKAWLIVYMLRTACYNNE